MERGRCAAHRESTAERGYGEDHQRARQDLKATLPGPCGYGCGRILEPDGDWVAAHVVDGQPELGYLASCRSCNERAKDGSRRPVPATKPNRDETVAGTPWEWA